MILTGDAVEMLKTLPDEGMTRRACCSNRFPQFPPVKVWVVWRSVRSSDELQAMLRYYRIMFPKSWEKRFPK